MRQGNLEAIWFIGQFRLLYKIERQAKNLGPTARRELRLRQAPPIWRAMKQRALALQGKTLPQSSLGKALSYFLNEYQALVGYLKNGLFELDNNLIENSIRGPVIGKNYAENSVRRNSIRIRPRLLLFSGGELRLNQRVSKKRSKASSSRGLCPLA